MITINQIYDYVESAVNTPDRPVYCASIDEPVPPMYPACQIGEIDHSQIRAATTIRFYAADSVSVRRDFEAHVYSNKKNGALTEARDIMTDVEDAFRSIGFIETFCGQAGTNDPAVVQIVARFTRNIADGDTLTI